MLLGREGEPRGRRAGGLWGPRTGPGSVVVKGGGAGAFLSRAWCGAKVDEMACRVGCVRAACRNARVRRWGRGRRPAAGGGDAARAGLVRPHVG